MPLEKIVEEHLYIVTKLFHVVIVAIGLTQEKRYYKAIFHELGIPNDSNIDVDVSTR